MDKIVVCEKCGAMVKVLIDCTCENCGIKCCGETMQQLIAGTTEASREKHIPEVSLNDKSVKVTVGSVLHPMTEEHYISWVYLETDKGGAFKHLDPTDAPEVVFALADEKPIAVYAYCNLHGLWKAEI